MYRLSLKKLPVGFPVLGNLVVISPFIQRFGDKFTAVVNLDSAWEDPLFLRLALQNGYHLLILDTLIHLNSLALAAIIIHYPSYGIYFISLCNWKSSSLIDRPHSCSKTIANSSLY
jgi:hypothetical protein